MGTSLCLGQRKINRCLPMVTTLKCIQVISSQVYAFEYLGPQEVLFGEVVETWKVRLRGRKYVTLGFEV